MGLYSMSMCSCIDVGWLMRQRRERKWSGQPTKILSRQEEPSLTCRFVRSSIMHYKLTRHVVMRWCTARSSEIEIEVPITLALPEHCQTVEYRCTIKSITLDKLSVSDAYVNHWKVQEWTKDVVL